ncbi:uncharacterized protein LOC108293711 isoform X7 [Cebus imitator]|uniref:uncharacterized protein LOC108293711 isoform X7 n=1 Tax=Cebus imitator TaxID=2715852 RepID=UPI001898360F|nr:uncharacterized protein LOC108293711 isoform X7 [Cebus imitator]
MESWSQCGLASMVHLMLAGDSGWGSCLERPTMCCRNRWSIVPGSGVTMESWSQCGPASMVHLVLAGGSGRGSCLEGPTTCCHNRWSILPSNRVPMELWSRCVLAPMVHLMLAGGSGRYDGTSPITWQGRWSVLLSHKGPQSPGVGMAWPPWCTPAGGWLRTGQLSWDVPHILARKMVRSCEPSRPPEPWSHYGLASMVHPLRWTAQEGAVALRGPPPAGMTDD